MASVEIIGADVVDLDLAGQSAKVQRAFVRAANRSIGSGRTAMTRLMAGDTGLKQKNIRESMVLQEATASRPEASLTAKLKRIPLIDFRARGPEPSRGKGRGVTYRLPGGKGRVENAFIATMSSGHKGVFRRKGATRLGIVELKGPSLGQVFSKFRPQGVARVLEVFDKNFDHEMDFAQSGGADAGAD